MALVNSYLFICLFITEPLVHKVFENTDFLRLNYEVTDSGKYYVVEDRLALQDQPDCGYLLQA